MIHVIKVSNKLQCHKEIHEYNSLMRTNTDQS